MSRRHQLTYQWFLAPGLCDDAHIETRLDHLTTRLDDVIVSGILLLGGMQLDEQEVDMLTGMRFDEPRTVRRAVTTRVCTGSGYESMWFTDSRHPRSVTVGAGATLNWK